MKYRQLSLFALAMPILLAGCVNGRRTFDLSVPPAPSYASGPSKGTFSVGTIGDVRHFENKPSDPSTPSINGDVNQLSPSARSTFIGRQRGSFGMAWGDITLPGGQTVQSKVADLLREGLKRRGYSVLANAETKDSISAEIQQFWSWTTPGFVALSFEAQITCRVVIIRNGKEVAFHVHGYGLNHGQFAKDVNWQQAYDAAYQDFLAKLDEQLVDAGL